MDKKQILNSVKEICDLKKKHNDEEFKKIINEEYKDFISRYKSIYQMCLSGEMDIKRLEFMLNMMDKVKKNEMSEYDASVKVDTKLVDELVKPSINKN